MASITRCGTCVPPGPSRNAAGCPLTVWAREGNCARTHRTSSAAVTAFSVAGIGFIYFYHGELAKVQRCGYPQRDDGIRFSDSKSLVVASYQADSVQRTLDNSPAF